MLENSVTLKIENFVAEQPRSIQEIAEHLNKNWRTADRYVQEIEKEYGTITTRTFRKGTRGALKIVFLTNIDKVSNTPFQEQLEKEILRGKKRDQFSAFDIFQHVTSKNKKVVKELETVKDKKNLKEFHSLLSNTKKELLILSGNLSFIHLEGTIQELEKLVEKNVKIKILCRVDIVGISNIEKILELNFKHGKNLIEIRHRDQPLRATIFDKKILRIKEVKDPTGKEGELNKKLFLFYTIFEKSWVEWISRIFEKMFSRSIDSTKRIKELQSLK